MIPHGLGLIPSASQDAVGWEDAPFLARLTGIYTPSTGAQANIHLYSFIEQTYDPTTGIPSDMTGGRQTYPAAPAAPADAYAIELANTALTVPGSTPSGYPNDGNHVGPYVWVRRKGGIAGAMVYEFQDQPGAGGGTTIQWVKVTDNTAQTITISGNSWKAYKAVLTSFSGSWNDTATFAWFFSANGDIPVVGNRYACISFGTAGDSNPVYGEDVVSEPTWVKVTSITPSTVTIEGTANTITAYPAAISTWSTASGTWTDGGNGTVWYYSPNGAIPALNYRYECLPFGMDNGGASAKTIWADGFAAPATQNNWGVVTTVAQEFAGDKRFDGSVGVGTAANTGISGFTVPTPNLGASHGLIVYGDSPGVSTNALCIEKSSLGTGAFIGISDLGGTNKSQLAFVPNTATLLGSDSSVMFWTGQIVASSGFAVGTTPNPGLTATITYVKTVDFVGQTVTTGTLTFKGGILTGST